MGDTVSTRDEINRWFQHHTGGGLILPSGWFGRPHDNLHMLSGLEENKDSLVLNLDNRLKLTFVGTVYLRTDNKYLQFSNFDKLIFEWEEYDSAQTHREVFSSGEVKIVLAPGA